MGRPTKWDEAYIGQAEIFAAMQLTQKEMAALWQMDEDTLTNWKREHPAFAEAITRGKARLMQECFQILLDDVRMGQNAETAKYLLHRLAPDRW